MTGVRATPPMRYVESSRLACATEMLNSFSMAGSDGVSIPSIYITIRTSPARMSITLRAYLESNSSFDLKFLSSILSFSISFTRLFYL